MRSVLNNGDQLRKCTDKQRMLAFAGIIQGFVLTLAGMIAVASQFLQVMMILNGAVLTGFGIIYLANLSDRFVVARMINIIMLLIATVSMPLFLAYILIILWP